MCKSNGRNWSRKTKIFILHNFFCFFIFSVVSFHFLSIFILFYPVSYLHLIQVKFLLFSYFIYQVLSNHFYLQISDFYYDILSVSQTVLCQSKCKLCAPTHTADKSQLISMCLRIELDFCSIICVSRSLYTLSFSSLSKIYLIFLINRRIIQTRFGCNWLNIIK